jgi:outer membrane translocation and assembly module TamA
MLTPSAVLFVAALALSADPAGKATTTATNNGPSPAVAAPERAGSPETKPLVGAVSQANAAVRRVSGADAQTETATSELAGAFWSEADVTDVTTDEAGGRVVRAEFVVDRRVTVASESGNAAVREASSAVSAARAGADRSLRDFERGWKPTNPKQTQYIVTKWGGCRNHWPRISADEFEKRRTAVIAKGKDAIAAAQDQLESVQIRVREERQELVRAARTVRLVLRADVGDARLERLQHGARVRVQVRVDSVTLATDPAGVRNPAPYVGTVHASLIDEPLVIADARPAKAQE